ncbi:MAG: efflux RND transporter periplasmic adaptor subunit [Planctomycetaceae bacterium]
MFAKICRAVRVCLSQLSTLAVLGTLGAMFIVGPKVGWNPMRLPALVGLAPPAADAAAGHVAADSAAPGAAEGVKAGGADLGSIEMAERVMEDVGLKTAVVERRDLVQQIVVPGELNYDPYLTAEVSSRVPGVVWRVEKKVGEWVTKGSVLALIDSADVGEAKSRLLQALVQVDLRAKIRKSLDEKVVPVRTIIEAEANLRDARVAAFNAEQTLRNLRLPIRSDDVTGMLGLDEGDLARRMQFLGLPDKVRETLEPDTATANLIPLIAPFDGIVIGRDLVVGETVGGEEKKYFTIADIRQMWVTLEVRQEDASRLVEGQEIEFVPDGDWQRLVQGTLSWISTEASDRTRTLQVRAVVENLEGRLRANTFGTGRIRLASRAQALVVPSHAVQHDAGSAIVFIREGRDAGAPRCVRREVETGIRAGSCTEIVSGVAEGEHVVTAGSFILRSELTRRRQTVASL